jgi:hypothetical protein
MQLSPGWLVRELVAKIDLHLEECRPVLDTVVHACSLSNWKTEAGVSLEPSSLRLPRKQQDPRKKRRRERGSRRERKKRKEEEEEGRRERKEEEKEEGRGESGSDDSSSSSSRKMRGQEKGQKRFLNQQADQLNSAVLQVSCAQLRM